MILREIIIGLRVATTLLVHFVSLLNFELLQVKRLLLPFRNLFDACLVVRLVDVTQNVARLSRSFSELGEHVYVLLE